jgi:hypothetical protein
MANMTVRRIGVLSAAKMYGIVGFVLGLVIGIPYGLIAMVVGVSIFSTGRGSDAAAGGAGTIVIGLLIMILFPIMYGILCFIMGLIGALIYNGAAKLVGGVQIELENAEPTYPVPPPQQPQQPWAPGSY